MTEPLQPSRQIFAALAGPELRGEELKLLADLAPGGVTLFSRNLRSVNQARELGSGIREIAGPDTLLAVDQEGGSVNRLRELDPVFAALPAARDQARWPLAQLREGWRAVGRALVGLGFDIDFAPVIDLDDGPGANGIGPRSFGADVPRAIACARAVLSGLAEAGIAGCLKHFPGLGETMVDTHERLSVCELEARELWERHVLPYRELHAESALIMTAHAHYPSVVGSDPLPATFSRLLVSGWLRKRLGFEGVITTDDLEMGAVARGNDPAQRSRRAIAAGADVLLFCGDLDAPRRARDALEDDLRSSRWDPDLLRASRARVDRLREHRAVGRGRDATDLAEALEELGQVLRG